MPPSARLCRGAEESYGEEINAIGILFEDTQENARAWLDEQGATYPTVRDVDGTLIDEFWISGIPRLIVIDQDRQLAWDQLGAGAFFANSVTQRLDALTGRKSPG